MDKKMDEKRFSRQSKINWWDQKKISNANLMVIGCGGIGTWACSQLTMLGVRRLVIVDMDTVDKSNLNRQLYFEESIGKYKVEAAKQMLEKINSKIKIDVYNKPIQQLSDDTYNNIDFVFDCLDNIETREFLSKKCWDKKIPFIHSACSDVIGEVQLIVNGKTKPLREYSKDMKKMDKKSCLDFDPAVCTTNMIVASLQVDKFLDYLIRKDIKNPFINYIRGNKLSYGGN
jgi:molybdopterin-synthase adenylyltransferase